MFFVFVTTVILNSLTVLHRGVLHNLVNHFPSVRYLDQELAHRACKPNLAHHLFCMAHKLRMGFTFIRLEKKSKEDIR